MECLDSDKGSERRIARILLAVVIQLIAVALVLGAMGRPAWGPSKMPGLWTGAVQSRFTSQRLADPYTFTHIGHGIVFFLILWYLLRDRFGVGARFVTAVALESGWEILENTPWVIERFRQATVAQGYYGDSVINSLGDILATIAGFGIGVWFPKRYAIGVFVVLEVLLVLWIRDNLVLNILMLVYPVPAIEQWQAG